MTPELARTLLPDTGFMRDALRELIDREIGMNIVDPALHQSLTLRVAGVAGGSFFRSCDPA